MNKNQLRKLIDAHLQAPEPECRWCFAIDKLRVKSKIIAQYNFPDAMLLHLRCPRCGGEFTSYSEIVEGEILKHKIYKLHPQLKGHLDKERFSEILDLMWPEYLKMTPEP